MARTWTIGHAHQAKAALGRLAAEADAEGKDDLAASIRYTLRTDDHTASIGAFVAALALHVDPRVDVERVLSRVCARAEGREVVEVETHWRVRRRDVPDLHYGKDEVHARRIAALMPGRRVVRVTLTRRRILKAKKGGG